MSAGIPAGDFSLEDIRWACRSASRTPCHPENEARGLITYADIQRVPLRELAASVLMREPHRTQLLLHRLRLDVGGIILRDAARRCYRGGTRPAGYTGCGGCLSPTRMYAYGTAGCFITTQLLLQPCDVFCLGMMPHCGMMCPLPFPRFTRQPLRG